jgi:Flp pilus assembly protein TadG
MMKAGMRRILGLRRLGSNEGSQLLEFAIALPLLLVFVVGIFDFGNAFNTKQKLSAAVREGARRGSNLPTGDLTNSGLPLTVRTVRDVVDQSLVGAGVNDCGLSGISGAAGSTPLSWRFSASGNGCPGTLTLTIERGFAFQSVIRGTTFYLISTRVTLSYPYAWHFNRVITLLVPGATYAGTTLISTNAVVPNMD